MLENENIICISYSTWEGPFTKSVVQLMSLLAERNRVLYVEYPFTVKDVVNTLRGKQDAPVARMLGLKKRVVAKTSARGTTVLNWVLPPLIPVNSIRNEWLYRQVLKIDTRICRRSIRNAIRKLDLGNPLIVNAYNPIFGEQLAGHLGEKVNVYYCYDGFATDRRGIRAWQADKRYAAQADGVIVSSDFLMEEKLKLNKNVIAVKNGVDFGLFNRAAKTVPGQPGMNRKIGYIGSIDQRFDLETVEYAIRNLPDFDFEFTGDVRNTMVKSILERYENVKFLPPVKPTEVPERLNRYHAGIIPYICNEINKNVYPLKINEFLAVGVPVVMTRFADLPEFEGHVFAATTREEFRDQVMKAATGDSVEKIAARTAFARSNSWESRAGLFASAIRTFMDRKKDKKN